MFTTSLAVITNPVIGSLGTGPGESGTAVLLATVIRSLVVAGGILMILYLILGGLNWIMAEGKPDKLERARLQIMEAVTGMVILAAVVAITSLIGHALGIQFLQTLNISIPNISQPPAPQPPSL